MTARTTLADLPASLATSPATVLVVTPDGHVTWANHGLRGEPASAVVGAPLALARHEHVLDALRRVARGGAPESLEAGDAGPAGPTAWWRLDVSAAGPERAVVVAVDITAQKQEEERLRRSESLLVDAQGVAHLGTWDWDVTQPHATWSAELYRIYGLTPQEYTPSYEGYLQMVHPDDRERVMRVTEACFKEHTPYSHDERIFRKDGELRWLHTWAVPVLDGSGKLARLLGVCQDVTENKRAEAAMRSQTMTRSLARRLLHDLMQRASIPEAAVRELGRGLAKEQAADRGVEAYASDYREMGLGNVRVVAVAGARYEFSGTDILERRAEAPLPTCHMTLGYLEGAVSALAGKRALGSEMRCQSLGHPECRFVVMAQ